VAAICPEGITVQRWIVTDIYQRENCRSIWLGHISHELVSHRGVLLGLHGNKAAGQNNSAAVRFTYGRIARSALKFRIERAVRTNKVFFAKE
jgi:hypothetical protein